MKKLYLVLNLLICSIFVSCNEQNQQKDDIIKFAICADYPPFEYINNNSFEGFDIDLAKLISREIGKKVEFMDMDFNNIFFAIQNGIVDAGISTINSSPERNKNFSFSLPYYSEDIAIIYRVDKPLPNIAAIGNSKIAVQLGTVYENWSKKIIPDTDLYLKNTTVHSVESLKARHVEGVILDLPQAKIFTKRNKGLAFSKIGEDASGFTIVYKKNAFLKEKIDQAIIKLKKNSEIEKLRIKHISSLDNE
jgi:polar amino acid transport system substrate-binding protein